MSDIGAALIAVASVLNYVSIILLILRCGLLDRRISRLECAALAAAQGNLG